MKHPSLTAMLLVSSLSAAALAAPVSVPLITEAPEALWAAENSRFEATVGESGTVLRWHLEAGQSSTLALRPESGLLAQLRHYDYARFELRIASGEVANFNLRMLGHVSGPRQYKVHDWQVAILTTARGLWHPRCFELARPNWFPWDNADGEGTDALFQFQALALAPGTVVELRGLTLTRAVIRLKPDFHPPITWPVLTRDATGNAVLTLRHHVQNMANRPLAIEAEIASAHPRFQVAVAFGEKADAAAATRAVTPTLKNGATAVFTVTATLPADAVAATPELYAEALQLRFRPAGEPQSELWWRGELVRPLSDTVRAQVILAPESVALIREHLPDDAALAKALGSPAILAGADAFLKKELLRIPGGHAHVRNNWIEPWRPGERMPEAVNTETGERQFDTGIAKTTWKEYLGTRGRALEHLATAYLFTGDERYARKAVDLLLLYARQYAELSWGNLFEPPWCDGPPILTSSRVAGTSTYGTNWHFKDHCRLLAAIAESPSWSEEERRVIYLGFVLPYATELMKFPGGISNMTDVTNRNLLLLGLVFRDAGLVRAALFSDAGLLPRLLDLTPDGFSSEGRPLNYHRAAMAEYLPSLAYLAQAHLEVDFPRERLLAAVRMPYRRATLAGLVPNSGDCGRGFSVGPSSEAHGLLDMFPGEAWLYDIGRGDTIPAQLRAWRTGKAPDPKAAAALLETTPTLFADAGLAILRQGGTAAEQVMATLDYGRNTMHAHLDRNTLTLSAFGHLYSHGPGTLYNVGSGGMTRVSDPKLGSFCGGGSLGQNVILIDRQNQRPAIGERLAWHVSPERQVVAARVPALAPGVDHTRALVLSRGIVVVLDRVSADRERLVDFVYHNFGEQRPGDGWTAEPEAGLLGATANYANLVDPHRLRGSGPVRLQWQVAETAHLALWQLPPPGATAYTAVTGMNNPQKKIIPDRAPSLITRAQGQTLNFLTVLEPHRGQPRVTGVEPVGSDGLLVRFADGPDLRLTLDELLAMPSTKP
jgi:hypothetical protein